MRGLFAFNDNNELLYLKADQQLLELLKRRRKQLVAETGPILISDDGDDDDATNPQNQSDNIDDNDNNNDAITIAYIFLPLIVVYKTMKCMKFDRYIYLRNEEICFYFADSIDDNDVLLLAVGDASVPRDEMTLLLQTFSESLEFVFGPLTSSIMHPTMTPQLRLLDACLDSGNDGTLQSTLRYVNASILSRDQTQSALAPSLSCLIGQFQAFIKCRLLLLIKKGTLLSAASAFDSANRNNGRWASENFYDNNNNNNKNNNNSIFVAKASHMITMLKNVDENNVSPGDTPSSSSDITACRYHYTIALRGDGGDQENAVFWDAFSLNITAQSDVLIFCLSPSERGELMMELTQLIAVIDKLDQLRFERAMIVVSTPDGKQSSPARKNRYFYDYWLADLDERARALCPRLNDDVLSVPGENHQQKTDPTKSTLTAVTSGNWSKLVYAFRLTWRNLHALTTNRRPDVAKVGDAEGEETSTLKSMRHLALSLLLETYGAAREHARRYKSEKLDRCWRNLLASNLYQSTIRHLTESCQKFDLECDSIHSRIDSAPSAVAFGLDAVAYAFAAPSRSLLLTNGFSGENFSNFPCTKLFRSWMIEGRRLTLRLIEINNSDKKKNMILIFLSSTMKNGNNKSLSGSETGFFSKLMASLSPSSSGHCENENYSEENYGDKERSFAFKEPLAILCAFEAYTNKDLAKKQTRQLAMHLYELISSVRWSFT